MFFKNPWNSDTMMQKLLFYGKSGVKGMKGTQNMKWWKFVINKDKNIWVGVYLNEVGATGWKLSGLSHDTECTAVQR